VETTARLTQGEGESLGKNEFATLAAAIAASLTGDTIVLAFGHHWEKDIVIDVPLRIGSEMDDPAKCVLELTGQIRVKARSAAISGISIRRPRKINDKMNIVKATNATVMMYSCILNNDGAQGCCVVSVNGSLSIFASSIRGGTVAGVMSLQSFVYASLSSVSRLVLCICHFHGLSVYIL
jgi:hypothetical protein